MTEPPPQYEYDVCFSFAYEDQEYVDAVAHKVKEMGLRLFYSPFVEAELWGENLHDYFSEIYSRKSRYCVMFISKHYADSIWTTLERKEAQARAFQESETYILPARFDRTEIPGLQKTVAYMSLVDRNPEDFARLIYRRVTGSDAPPDVPNSDEPLVVKGKHDLLPQRDPSKSKIADDGFTDKVLTPENDEATASDSGSSSRQVSSTNTPPKGKNPFMLYMVILTLVLVALLFGYNNGGFIEPKSESDQGGPVQSGPKPPPLPPTTVDECKTKNPLLSCLWRKS